MTSCTDCNKCNRENSERGNDYNQCRAVHAEMNAIISASRRDMIGADLYLVGIDVPTQSYVKNVSPCSLCKRLIINSGIEKVYVRTGVNSYNLIYPASWTDEDILGGY